MKASKKPSGDREQEEKKAADKTERSTTPATSWVVTASGSRSLGATGPLVEAIRAAVAAGRGACLNAAAAGKPIRLRLTIDAHGRVARVELVTGDRSADACLRALLMGLSSATAADGNPTGTVQITLRARS